MICQFIILIEVRFADFLIHPVAHV